MGKMVSFAVGCICDTNINDINSIGRYVASAVEQPSIASNEISNNVTQASRDIEGENVKIAVGTVVIEDIAQEVSSVNYSASDISESNDNI